MFRQVRMTKWRADATEGSIREAIAAMTTLADQIRDVRAWHHAESTSPHEDDFDLVLIVDFDDEQAYARYLEHPAHIHLVTTLIRPILETTVRIRYHLGPEPSA